MSIAEYGPYFNPVCDVCGHMLPAVIVQRRVTAAAADAARTKARAKMAADGWEERDGKDVCVLCLRTERKTGVLPEKPRWNIKKT